MTERQELTVARLRCGISIAVTARATGVDEGRLGDFENRLHSLTVDETDLLHAFYADLSAAIEESPKFPNVFDARDVSNFVGQFRYRREARARNQKFLDDNCLDACGRLDPAKIAKRNAEAAAEASRRMIEKAKVVVENATAEMNYLAGPKK